MSIRRKNKARRTRLPRVDLRGTYVDHHDLKIINPHRYKVIKTVADVKKASARGSLWICHREDVVPGEVTLLGVTKQLEPRLVPNPHAAKVHGRMVSIYSKRHKLWTALKVYNHTTRSVYDYPSQAFGVGLLPWLYNSFQACTAYLFRSREDAVKYMAWERKYRWCEGATLADSDPGNTDVLEIYPEEF